jgi:hypothetical protein
VDRWSLPATAGLDGWPPAGAVPQGAPTTEPGVQPDSSVAHRLTCGFGITGDHLPASCPQQVQCPAIVLTPHG